MDIDQLIGRQVRIIDLDGDMDFPPAVIRAIDSDFETLLVEFVSPFRIGAVTYPIAVASPRLERDDLMALLRDGVLSVGLTCVPQDRYNSAKPFDVSWWRGGGAATADLVLQVKDVR